MVNICRYEFSCGLKFCGIFVFFPHLFAESFRLLLVEKFVHFIELHVLIFADREDNTEVEVNRWHEFLVIIGFDKFLNDEVREKRNVSLVKNVLVDF